MLEKIATIRNLSDSDEALRSFVFKYPEKASTCSARAMAAAIPCSPSTVTRFVKKCGFHAYHDFQLYIKNEVSEIMESSMTGHVFFGTDFC
ncbi:hypothetical protein MFLO_10089 [Listeria floridensis FSL S10-1187]|uniref:HTH rpiR-type domain-containing protein n=1 Tax=Listeria floridensis FSL S10-1187 TaxID=1265817 RepID=A0ABN0RE25_9LIST|nr:MurR/RpiR family transcriptional regulator [Listeria floridensis]EUJ30742.1 hypothetical protein MFLO_10089 [Listeria floridensis FSL S10-1187]